MTNLARSGILGATFFAALTGSGWPAQTVEWYFSDSLHNWVHNAPLQTVQTIPAGTPTVTIYPDSLRQEILGFGGCFNEKGWNALSTISAAARDSVVRALFDTSGCALNYCRMPIGASDYGLSVYTFDDTANDFALNHFSINRDKLCLIPYIKAAQAYSPDLQVWGVPWTVPGWMMQSGVFCTAPMFGSLALYFEKYVQSYREQGINVVAVHVGNEPCGGGGGVNTVYTADQMHTFIRDYLGPRFAQDTVNAQIWQGDLNCSYDSYVAPVLDDAATARYVTGAGLQYAGEPDIGKVGQNHPDKMVMESESDCFDGSNSWSQGGFWLLKYMHDDFNNGANAFMQWNMVLDQTGKNLSGWVQNAMVTVDTTRKTVTYNPQFYSVKHFSNFVRRGAHRCAVSGVPGTQMLLAFVNPSGDIVVVDRIQGSGTLALKAGTEAALVNLTDGVHTFVFNHPTATGAARVVRRRDDAMAIAARQNGSGLHISYALPATIAGAEARVQVFDLHGSLRYAGAVEPAAAGVHTVDVARGGLESGRYLCRLQTGNRETTVEVSVAR